MKYVSRNSRWFFCLSLVFAGSAAAQEPPRFVDLPPEAVSGNVSGYAYICEVAFIPRSLTNEQGNYGLVQVSFHTQPHCGGTNLRWGAFYSKGATYGDPNYQYSESGLDRLYNSLDHAAQTGRKIKYSCWSTALPCGWVGFVGK